MGQKCNILFFETPEDTFLHETTSFDVLIVKIGAVSLAVRRHKNPKNIRGEHTARAYPARVRARRARTRAGRRR